MTNTDFDAPATEDLIDMLEGTTETRLSLGSGRKADVRFKVAFLVECQSDGQLETLECWDYTEAKDAVEAFMTDRQETNQ